ncbi:6-phosphogluconolactonase [Citromicrobium bathyomarinum]|uniref:6-phosphogluconolactonase n=1 Tax=unclassified Citromicrobium TaxID=2630544 RepID=UPI0006C92015|nr:MULTISPECIES: 6-phosphogluconolactonase [unclassified Citromicrobium]KPM22545.1 6-phosphogluconolactonase [Citromicrobium sp. RCC1885]KPM26028.1 6-phosphogluconolactonase [Citromicrobium sp. RCC1878]MAO04817.1 6-phosphogluconolactonase [Citromicrobium sp.]OAM07886.1 6-phosphogluconolactonase [Citromicrobium sp. RCC1897]|tara:strand:- start:1405 stop:2022 length:618 start_codon:yes stop_codon:yes gene_type:complete
MSDLRWAPDGSAKAVADHIERVVGASDAPVIAVPGGSTPVAIFAELAERGLDWSGATIMLGDDRQVPRDHEASNQAKLERALGDSGAKIVALEEGMAVPDLDLLWLGMGTDGHIASLFPQMQAEDRPGRAVIRTVPDPLPPEAPFPRLSMNFAALTKAPRESIIVLRGADKKQVIERAQDSASDLPVARFLREASGPVTIYWSAQ